MNLTTVRAVQAYTNAPGPANNALLAMLISSASSAALQYLDRDLFQQNYTHLLDGTGTKRLILKQGPVTAVSAVAINGVSLPLSTNAMMAGYIFDSLGLWRRGWVWPMEPQIVSVAYTAGYAPTATTDAPVAVPSGSPLPPTILSSQNPYWFADVGVSYWPSGTPLTKVAASPSTGEYTVDGQGNYTFASGDAGELVSLSYTILGIPLDICQAVNEWVGVMMQRRTKLANKSETLAQQTVSYITTMPPTTQMVLDLHKRLFPA